MFKIVLVVAVLLGIAWSYAPTRQQIAVRLVQVAEKLGPVGDVVLNPVRKYSTQSEVGFIVDQIRMARLEGRQMPGERTFAGWLKQRVKTKWKGVDAWGFPYYLTQKQMQFTVGSVGPDGKRGTGDDIRETVQF
jgi:hypothetical protein